MIHGVDLIPSPVATISKIALASVIKVSTTHCNLVWVEGKILLGAPPKDEALPADDPVPEDRVDGASEGDGEAAVALACSRNASLDANQKLWHNICLLQ